MTAFAGKSAATQDAGVEANKKQLLETISRLMAWLDANDYRGYDTFDGLSAKYLRPLTFNTKLLRTVLQQGVRRFPINLRPLLGIPKSRSTKGMGFLAKGFLRLHHATGESQWKDRAEYAFQWLIDHQSPGYSGACWGNHFDYQSRSFYLPAGVPTIVWTSLIGHAFLDGYESLGNGRYLEIADSACQHIVHDLERYPDGEGLCISYIPTGNNQVHNSNTLGGSFLARTYQHTGNTEYKDLAAKAMQYTAQHQRSDASWYYGEAANLRWVDNFHTAYVLDSFKLYMRGSGDERFRKRMLSGYDYWKKTFFLPDGTPRYYSHKTLPLDIQCCSQAIDTFTLFREEDPDSLRAALSVADWTVRNMQDSSGYFYYRRYNSGIVNKTPTLHWGQATMLCALAGLYQAL
jgi:hypothetical protein